MFSFAFRGKDWIKWLLYTVLIGAALLVSQSQGPWIAAAIILGMAVLTSGSGKKWILIGTGAVFMGIFAAVPTLRIRALSILDRSHHSNIERLHMWHAGWQLWKSHPLLGIGPGNVKQVSAGFENAGNSSGARGDICTASI